MGTIYFTQDFLPQDQCEPTIKKKKKIKNHMVSNFFFSETESTNRESHQRLVLLQHHASDLDLANPSDSTEPSAIIYMPVYGC